MARILSGPTTPARMTVQSSHLPVVVTVSTLAAFFSIVPLQTAVHAGGAPTTLLGRSVVVSWNETNRVRYVGQTDYTTTHPSMELRIYVSTAGRVFSRLTATKRSRTGSIDEISGESGSTSAPTFGDHSLTIIKPMKSGGATRVVIDFDAAFSGCKVTADFGKEVGHDTAIKHVLLNKADTRLVEVESVSMDNATCVVQNGNVFGGE
jgi:hypothetical protein